MDQTNDASNRTLTLERTFDAPLKLVWEAWTQPEHIASWWSKGLPMNIVEHDFSVGGKWKYSVTMPNGSEFVSEGTYAEIVPMEKIVTSADFKPMTEGVTMHMEFEANGDKTNFKFSVVHETEEYCKQQEKMGFYNGWGSFFENLNDYFGKLVG